jgi:hypothetical protein
VQLAKFPDAGVPKTGVVKVGDVKVLFVSVSVVHDQPKYQLHLAM